MTDLQRDATSDGGALPLHRQFEFHAAQSPDRCAVWQDGHGVSYACLNASANQLARQLIARGARTDALIPVFVGRSPAAIVSVLAVLKAGAAYVPIDPQQPVERTQEMLAIIGADVAIADPQTIDLWPDTSTPVLVAELMSESDAAVQPAANPAVRVEPEHLAYCMHTSGSTGKPKGILQTHGTLTNLFLWQRSESAYAGAHERTLQFAYLGFDVSAQEILFTLASGGALVLLPSGAHRDLETIARAIVDARVTTLYSPNTPLQILASLIGKLGPSHALSHVISAGEPLYCGADLQRLTSAGRARLHNQYGPTETHVVTAHSVPQKSPSTYPPLGKPVSRVSIHVLDADLRPQPAGVIGDIYVSGASLARGYLGSPDLTADRFVPNPFGAPGTRMYRTGDRGAWRSDGELVFHGRSDFQVKVRGFRIELEEIESVLREFPQVRDVVAVAFGTGEDRRLAAFVGSAPAELDIPKLREHLVQRLPDYMIPSVLTVLPQLPLNANGKVDRAALPLPTAYQRARPNVATAFVEPQTSLEIRVAMIWAEMLGLERVGLDDRFFELGGTSLLAVKLTERLRSEGLGVSVADVLGSGTIAALLRMRDGGPSSKPVARPAIRYSRRGHRASPAGLSEPDGARQADGVAE